MDPIDRRKLVSVQLIILFLMSLSMSLSGHTDDSDYDDLDGVLIRAIDQYPSTKKNEYALGFGYIPFETYYHGLSLNGAFTRYFNKKWAWEVINASIVFGVEKGITTAIAEEVGSQPEFIEETEWIVSSNIKYVLSYGKSIFFDEYIRLTRTEILAGLGSVATNLSSYISVNLGFQTDFVISEHFSWKLEFMNYYTPTKEGAGFFDTGMFRAYLAWRFK